MTKRLAINTVIHSLQVFANKHGLMLEQKGECGLGRPCVGFVAKNGNYLDYNPFQYARCADHNDVGYVWSYDNRLSAPNGVNAYHKHSCFAVLVYDDDYRGGLRQLLEWVKHIESQGEVYVTSYETGAKGLQIIVSGLVGYALRFKA